MQNLKDTYQRTYEQTEHALEGAGRALRETEQGMEEY